MRTLPFVVRQIPDTVTAIITRPPAGGRTRNEPSTSAYFVREFRFLVYAGITAEIGTYITASALTIGTNIFRVALATGVVTSHLFLFGVFRFKTVHISSRTIIACAKLLYKYSGSSKSAIIPFENPLARASHKASCFSSPFVLYDNACSFAVLGRVFLPCAIWVAPSRVSAIL